MDALVLGQVKYLALSGAPLISYIQRFYDLKWG